ncbi:MAG TPA: hypothetical protein VGO92_08280 [Acidimicrobiales bacterium]|jgi:hypothetical protein|nr:hypothetical protein [Acidimicrobiales bacterium]
MLIQVITGKVADADLLQRQGDRWQAEIKPGAAGFLGVTRGVTPDGRAITVARFESEAAAAANSDRPEQSAWWNETAKGYDGDVVFQNCTEVDTMLGGGSNEAGFVQVMQGRAKDQAEMRKQIPELEASLREERPDHLGMVIAWHGDGGGFTTVNYFTSEAEARKHEASTEASPLRERFMTLMDGPLDFYDLPTPDLD